MVEAIRDGETDPDVLARLADPRLRAKPDTLRAALKGRVTEHHRIMLGLYLDHIDATQRAIARIERHVEAALLPYRKADELIVTMPGMGPRAQPLADVTPRVTLALARPARPLRAPVGAGGGRWR
jgi:transposase